MVVPGRGRLVFLLMLHNVPQLPRHWPWSRVAACASGCIAAVMPMLKLSLPTHPSPRLALCLSHTRCPTASCQQARPIRPSKQLEPGVMLTSWAQKTVIRLLTAHAPTVAPLQTATVPWIRPLLVSASPQCVVPRLLVTEVCLMVHRCPCECDCWQPG